MRFLFCILLLAVVPVAAFDSPFRWSAAPGAAQVEIRVDVGEGAYLDWNGIHLAVADKNGPVSAPVTAPVPRMQKGTEGTLVPVLTAGMWRWIFRGTPPFWVTVEYQGCQAGSEDGGAVCLMPERKELLPVTETVSVATGNQTLLPEELHSFRVERTLSGLTDTAGFLRFLHPGANVEEGISSESSSGFLWMALIALFGGIVLNLTPCVLPMIPINLAILGVGQGSSAKSGFLRGLAYGGGIAAAYGVLGLAVVLGGTRFGTLNAHPWFNFFVAILFFGLALASAGIFPLDLSRFGRVRASRLPGGAFIAAFLMGAMAALLAGACVAPVVISVLLFSAEQYQMGNGFALFLPLVLGIGMGLPWPLAGAGVGILPKPGRYMVWIKYGFSVLIAAAGIYYAGIGWSLLRHDSAAEFLRLEQALKQSRAEQKPLLLEFSASWCKNCRAMEKNVLSRSEVKNAMRSFVVCRFQAENLNAPRTRALLDAFHLPGLPAFVLLRSR